MRVPGIPCTSPAFRYVRAEATDISKRLPSSTRSPIQKLLDRVAEGTTTASDAATLASALGVIWSKQ
jgi:hypothetical protein